MLECVRMRELFGICKIFLMNTRHREIGSTYTTAENRNQYLSIIHNQTHCYILGFSLSKVHLPENLDKKEKVSL